VYVHKYWGNGVYNVESVWLFLTRRMFINTGVMMFIMWRVSSAISMLLYHIVTRWHVCWQCIVYGENPATIQHLFLETMIRYSTKQILRVSFSKTVHVFCVQWFWL